MHLNAYFIFHAPDQPLKSLSFDINSPQRPWALHLHTGQAGQFTHRRSSFLLRAPGASQFSSSTHQTTHQADKTPCSPPPPLPPRLHTPQESNRPARRHGGVTWNHERRRQGSVQPPDTCRSGIRSGHGPLSSTLLCVFVRKRV